MMLVGTGNAQQIIYSTLKDVMRQKGDTLTTLRIEKRNRNQIMLMGGADYKISVEGNHGLSRYLKSRCYAVQNDSLWYVNTRKVRYKRFRFGGWYAPAIWVKGNLYFCAQPVGSIAAEGEAPLNATRLGGEVGTAIASSGLVNSRVYYEIDTETGKVEFVDHQKMLLLLSDRPALRRAFRAEKSDSGEVIGRYLLQLQTKETRQGE